MKNKLIEAFSWDFIGSIIGVGVNFVTTIILARLLTPEEFGLIALCIAILSIFSLIIDFGLSRAVIQTKSINDILLSSVFFLNLFLGVIFFSIIILTASRLAYYLEAPMLEDLFYIISITIIFNSLSNIQVIILSRQLEFKKLSIKSTIAKVLGAIVGIVMAINEYGVYALIFQYLISSSINCLLVWGISDWRPKFVFSFESIKTVISFSIYVFFGQILNKIIVSLDDIVIGKLFTIKDLGFFNRANSLVVIGNDIMTKSINTVFFSFLSKIQNDINKFERVYFSIYSSIAIISFGITGLTIFFSEEIIINVFGKQWYPSIPIFQVIMFKLITFPTSSFLVVALLSRGFSKQNFYHGIPKKLLKLSSFLVAYIYGLNGFLIATVSIGYMTIIYNNIINSHYINVSLYRQLRCIFIPFFLFLISLGIIYLYIYNYGNNWLIESLGFIFIYSFFIYLFQAKELKQISQIINNAR